MKDRKHENVTIYKNTKRRERRKMYKCTNTVQPTLNSSQVLSFLFFFMKRLQTKQGMFCFCFFCFFFKEAKNFQPTQIFTITVHDILTSPQCYLKWRADNSLCLRQARREKGWTGSGSDQGAMPAERLIHS